MSFEQKDKLEVVVQKINLWPKPRDTRLREEHARLVCFSDPGLHQSEGPIWMVLDGSQPKTWVNSELFANPEDVVGERRLPSEIRHLWSIWKTIATKTKALHLPCPGTAPVPAIRFAWSFYFYDVSSDDLAVEWWEFNHFANEIRKTLEAVGCQFSIYLEDQEKNRPNGIDKNPDC